MKRSKITEKEIKLLQSYKTARARPSYKIYKMS